MAYNYKTIALASLFMCGCALRVQNIKPAAPIDFARLDQMAKYSQAAYSDAATIRALCRVAYNDVYIQTIAASNNQYFIATSTLSRTQLISIAGTANFENALTDADLTPENVPELGISLHRGFSRAAKLIYNDMKPRLISGYRVELTGHSLGGAEAVIVAMLMKHAGTPAATIVTFGQPRVSNQAGSDAYFDLPLTRVVNEDDLVPELPPIPYSHIAPEVVLFPGAEYSLIQDRPFDPAELIALWNALRAHQSPPELAYHYIANTVTNLDAKVTSNTLVPYHE